MEFSATRIFTDDVDRLAVFYERVTGITASRPHRLFAELRIGTGVLAIASTDTVPLLGAGVAEAGANRSIALDVRVEDVDSIYPTLSEAVETFVNEPTNMPWGNRSLLFRDPDGNLVNFFTPATDSRPDQNA